MNVCSSLEDLILAWRSKPRTSSPSPSIFDSTLSKYGDFQPTNVRSHQNWVLVNNERVWMSPVRVKVEEEVEVIGDRRWRFMRNPHLLLQVVKSVMEVTNYRFVLFTSGYEPLEDAATTLLLRSKKMKILGLKCKLDQNMASYLLKMSKRAKVQPLSGLGYDDVALGLGEEAPHSQLLNVTFEGDLKLVKIRGQAMQMV
ncbi:hypothetical protein LXL04_019214 [Taraxacum kok-saghyz]